MYTLFSYFYPSSIQQIENEIKPVIEKPSKFKYSHIDAHLLLWDIHHLTYNEIEQKYNAKYLTICNILKSEGFSIFKPGCSTNIESKTLAIPQELLLS